MAVKKPEYADNVKACILHVMNMDHAKKKAEHMQQKKTAKSRPWMFPFSNKNRQESTFGRLKSKFREVGWNLSSKTFEGGNIRRLT